MKVRPTLNLISSPQKAASTRRCRRSPPFHTTEVNNDTRRCKHRCRHTKPRMLLQRLRDTCHSVDKTTSQRPAHHTDNQPHECVHTDTQIQTHTGWSARTRAPEEPQIEKTKTTTTNKTKQSDKASHGHHKENGFHPHPEPSLPALLRPHSVSVLLPEGPGPGVSGVSYPLSSQNTGTVEQGGDQGKAFPHHNRFASFTAMTCKIGCSPASECGPPYPQSYPPQRRKGNRRTSKARGKASKNARTQSIWRRWGTEKGSQTDPWRERGEEKNQREAIRAEGGERMQRSKRSPLPPLPWDWVEQRSFPLPPSHGQL